MKTGSIPVPASKSPQMHMIINKNTGRVTWGPLLDVYTGSGFNAVSQTRLPILCFLRLEPTFCVQSRSVPQAVTPDRQLLSTCGTRSCPIPGPSRAASSGQRAHLPRQRMAATVTATQITQAVQQRRIAQRAKQPQTLAVEQRPGQQPLRDIV